MDYLNIIFGLITMISLGFTIFYGRKALKLEKDRKKIEWADLQSSANDLSGRIKKDKFIPDLIFTPGLRGATIVNLLLNELSNEIPVYVGISYWKETVVNFQVTEDNELIETNKWYVSIPKYLLARNDKKILIVDDFVMSGDFLHRLINLLEFNNFSRSNIRSMAIVTTRVAIQNHKEPDYHWIESSDANFYFPWGKAK